MVAECRMSDHLSNFLLRHSRTGIIESIGECGGNLFVESSHFSGKLEFSLNILFRPNLEWIVKLVEYIVLDLRRSKLGMVFE